MSWKASVSGAKLLVFVRDDVYNVYMIRKQLYLEETQDRALKRRAKELGVTEAEVVRRALDDALKPATQTRENDKALDELFAEADAVAKKHSFGEYRFDRQELYENDPRQGRR